MNTKPIPILGPAEVSEKDACPSPCFGHPSAGIPHADNCPRRQKFEALAKEDSAADRLTGDQIYDLTGGGK